MIESVMTRKNLSVKTKITVKSALCAVLVALSVALPQIAHLAGGASAGVKFLPMYLPALMAGCLLGPVCGLCVAVASPLVSFALTSAVGNAMPAAARLPFVLAELAVMATIAGAFEKKIAKNPWWVTAACACALVAGRGIFALLALLLQNVSTMTFATAIAQIETGLIGAALIWIITCVVTLTLHKVLNNDDKK